MEFRLRLWSAWSDVVFYVRDDETSTHNNDEGRLIACTERNLVTTNWTWICGFKNYGFMLQSTMNSDTERQDQDYLQCLTFTITTQDKPNSWFMRPSTAHISPPNAAASNDFSVFSLNWDYLIYLRQSIRANVCVKRRWKRMRLCGELGKDLLGLMKGRTRQAHVFNNCKVCDDKEKLLFITR